MTLYIKKYRNLIYLISVFIRHASFMCIHVTSVNNDSLSLKLVTIQSPIHTFSNYLLLSVYGTSPVAEMVKNLPATWGTWVKSLGWEDPLEEGMATHSSILAWRIPWTEGPGGLQSIGSPRVRHDWSDLACMHLWYTVGPCSLSYTLPFVSERS